jgi:hypothetical protein
MSKMTEDELRNLVTASAEDAIDFHHSELSRNRELAQKYYFGEKVGNEVEGLSGVISKDVADSIDWMLPSLMKTFASDKAAVRFDPETVHDVDLAEEATDYGNYVFFRKNNGFQIMHDWFKDALMFKVGIVKHFWDDKVETETEVYTNLDPIDLELLMTDSDVQIVEAEELENGQMDVTITRTMNKSQIRIENIPPEEFLINRSARCLESASFIAHRCEMTRSDLVGLGVKDDVLDELQFSSYDRVSTSPERTARESFNGNYTVGAQDVQDTSQDTVWVTEAYIKVDFDGDGLSELRKVIVAGHHILHNEPFDRIPFSTLCPTPIQHQFFGQSIFDATKEIQDTKTALLRNILDNMYRLNNGRYEVLEGQVNMGDLENNVPGGAIRTKMQGALTPLATPPLPVENYGMLDYMDKLRTNRTGVSERTQGLDDKALNSHTSASTVNNVMSVAEQRLELIARIFAETGVRDLFLNIYRLSKKHVDKEEIFRLRGKFIRVNPRIWKDRTSMEVVVGLGTNNKDQQLQHLMRLYELQQGVVSNGGMGILTDETRIYNTLTEITSNAGYKDYDNYWLDPESEESQQAKAQQQQQQAEVAAIEKAKEEAVIMKDQSEAAKTQAETKQEQLKTQLDAQFKQFEQELKSRELNVKEREIALKEREAGLEEDKQNMEREKFDWRKQIDIVEVTLEKNQERSVSVGDGKTFKGRNEGKTSSGNTGG